MEIIKTHINKKIKSEAKPMLVRKLKADTKTPDRESNISAILLT